MISLLICCIHKEALIIIVVDISIIKKKGGNMYSKKGRSSQKRGTFTFLSGREALTDGDNDAREDTVEQKDTNNKDNESNQLCPREGIVTIMHCNSPDERRSNRVVVQR